MRTLLGAVALALVGCGDDIPDAFDGLVLVSGPSPYVDGCEQEPVDGVLYRGSEVEPSIAVDPTDARHWIGMWQQDRWSNGGSRGLGTAVTRDGGATWTQAFLPWSRCGGGTVASGGDYERATDPWVSFGPTGTAYAIGLAFDNATARNAVLVARSDDGGATWGPTQALQTDEDPDVFNDKESILADPTAPGRVFAMWDRLTGQLQPTMPIGTGPLMFARAVDDVWEPARAIYDPGVDAQTIGAVAAVLPDGAVVIAFARLFMISTDHATAELAVIRSTDHGATWSAPIAIAPWSAHGIGDPHRTDTFIRDGSLLPSIAVDPTTGLLYVVWEGTAQDGQPDTILAYTSSDGGQTWTRLPSPAPEPSVAAFTPTVAVNASGAVGVSYYDQRGVDLGDADSFRARAWLATSTDHGATWSNTPLSERFDLRRAAVGKTYFLGDYQGLAVAGEAFVPFFGAAIYGADPSGIFTRPLP
ncbi:MAG: glycoside hydrolase [Deltaproteobacteria bacterium]|nr:glycoside hydrolase [Deltaproteobacteria bacterium]